MTAPDLLVAEPHRNSQETSMSDQGSYPPPGQPPVGPPPPGAVPPPGQQAPWYPQQGYPQPGYPPGYPQPGYPQQGYPQPGYPPGYPPMGYPPMLAAAHKPGAIPIRPLRLGDIYDAAFKIIRINPGATVGSAVLVTAVAMAIPLLITGVLASILDFSLSGIDSDGSDITLGVGTLLQLVGLIFVTGMITHVASAAALGRRLNLASAWAATAGKRWKLVGLTAFLYLVIALYLAAVVLVIVVAAIALPTPLDVLLGILVGLLGVVGLVFGWVRLYYLAVPPLMLEDIGVFGAIGRAWTLSGGSFWRIFGISLLTALISQIIGGIIAVPFGIITVIVDVGSDSARTAALVYLLANAVATVASSAFVAPFTASVTAVQYIDQRMRKEGYDVELLSRAGLA